ncbi:Isochorismate lyase [Alteripontixanthobacter maritimus]|uniref:chorismate mutase n=1 Tax=Alteripontixanthobacter maritimus TaxID=2161824 RepID=A0A369Q4P0_9SPHN|nr:chorismate mutase [Alteripontixanthobacter maritimus]RDC59861.1 Isochorismate lyase [Alteripontixanthobacter maritimus]
MPDNETALTREAAATMPDECMTMAEVRRGVDATDRELFALLERRFGYMRAAARIKQDRGEVRDEARKAAVIAAIREDAVQAGLPARELAEIWEKLVEASIAYEFAEWDRIR